MARHWKTCNFLVLANIFMNGPIVPSYVNTKSAGALSYNSEHQSCDFQELDQRMSARRL